MPRLIYKHIDYVMPELGDLKHRVIIYDRTIVEPKDLTSNYDLSFKKKLSVWASWKTIKGDVIFDEVNTDKTITHIGVIRYLPFLTQEYWVYYDNRYFDIVRVQDINEQKRFQILYCNLRGFIDKPASEA
jgi:hypothetical protein